VSRGEDEGGGNTYPGTRLERLACLRRPRDTPATDIQTRHRFRSDSLFYAYKYSVGRTARSLSPEPVYGSSQTWDPPAHSRPPCAPCRKLGLVPYPVADPGD